MHGSSQRLASRGSGDLDLQTVETFCAVVATGGFSLAAARVSLSQSAVTKHIGKLEEAVGVSLFERSGFCRSVRLTPDGVSFLESARRILAAEERLFSELGAGGGDDPNGPVRVASPVAVLPEALLDFLRNLRLVRPDVRWTLEHREIDATTPGLLPPDADLAALWLPDDPRLFSRLTTRVIAEEPAAALVSSRLPLSHRAALTRADVISHPVVRLPTAKAPDPYRTPYDGSSRSGIERAVERVMNRDGVAVLPKCLARSCGAGAVQLDLLDGDPFHLAVVRRDECPPALAGAVDRAVDVTRRLL